MLDDLALSQESANVAIRFLRSARKECWIKNLDSDLSAFFAVQGLIDRGPSALADALAYDKALIEGFS
jgi:hypothetical protein